MQLETCTQKVARPLAPKTLRPSQFTAVQILSLTMSHLMTPSNVTTRLSVVFSHALHFWHAPFARTASTLPVGKLPRGSSRPGTHWCYLAYELLLSTAWHSLVLPGLSAFPPEQCCSLARCPTPSQWDPAFSFRNVPTRPS